MPTLTHTFEKSGATAATGKVAIKPVNPQFLNGGATTLLQQDTFYIGQDGTITVSLDPGYYVVTALLEPAGSGSAQYQIQMPATGGPYNLQAILTTGIPADAVNAISQAAVLGLLSGYVPRFATAPTDHVAYPTYLDTSVVPPALMGWNGTAYVSLTGNVVINPATQRPAIVVST